MLKLTISNSIFNTISANLLKGAAAVQHMELTHKELKTALREDLTEKAVLLEKDVDTYIKEENESRTKRFTRIIEEMNTGSIPSVENNKIRVTSTKDEVTLELKTEFLSDAIDIAGNIFVDSLKASAETFLHYRRVKGMLKSFVTKWDDKPKQETEVKSDTVSNKGTSTKTFAQEIEDIPGLVSNLEAPSVASGSTFIANNGVALAVGSTYSSIALDEETILRVHYLNVIAKDGKTYSITPYSVKRILQAQEVNKELQSSVALPYSVMKAVRQAYPTLVAHFAAQQESK